MASDTDPDGHARPVGVGAVDVLRVGALRRAPAAIGATPLNRNHLAGLSFLKVVVRKPVD